MWARTVCLALLASGAFGQPLFAASLSWRCEFPGFKEPITFLDLGKGLGKVVRSADTSDVWVVTGEKAISFVEPVVSGEVMSATIVVTTGEAIYSRNTITTVTGSPLMPSQVIGMCKASN